MNWWHVRSQNEKRMLVCFEELCVFMVICGSNVCAGGL